MLSKTLSKRNATQREDATIEGTTSDIFISRYTIFEDAVEEMMRGDLNFSYPLCVKFIGEEAEGVFF